MIRQLIHSVLRRRGRRIVSFEPIAANLEKIRQHAAADHDWQVIAQCLTEFSKPVVYLKIDTQGYDLAVLRGTVETLKCVPVLQMEAAVRPIYEGVDDFKMCST